MISLDKELEVRQLIADGFTSQREIHKKTGVSRGTISSIMKGTFRVRKTNDSDAIEAGGTISPSGEYVRCPGCGGMVQMPCLLCYFSTEGNKYPKNVLEVYRQPKPKSMIRRCMTCGKIQSTSEFRGGDFKTGGSVMCLSVCRRCRINAINAERNRIKSGGRLDSRKVRSW